MLFGEEADLLFSVFDESSQVAAERSQEHMRGVVNVPKHRDSFSTFVQLLRVARELHVLEDAATLDVATMDVATMDAVCDLVREQLSENRDLWRLDGAWGAGVHTRG